MKESKSSLQSKGCKRKTTVQLDELSDILCSMGVCSAAKKVSFNIGGNEFSVTFDRRVFFSDKSMCMAGCFENRDSCGKRKGRVLRSKRMSLSE
jgi:hypothetical protein